MKFRGVRKRCKKPQVLCESERRIRNPPRLSLESIEKHVQMLRRHACRRHHHRHRSCLYQYLCPSQCHRGERVTYLFDSDVGNAVDDADIL